MFSRAMICTVGIFIVVGMFLKNPGTSVDAQGVVSDTTYDSIASEVLTVSTTALPISAGVLTVSGVPADKCYISIETQSVRWNTSPTTPTAAIGHLVAAAGTITINGRPDLASFRIIRQGGADATAMITCSRRLRF